MKIYTLRPDTFTLNFNFTLSGTLRDRKAVVLKGVFSNKDLRFLLHRRMVGNRQIMGGDQSARRGGGGGVNGVTGVTGVNGVGGVSGSKKGSKGKGKGGGKGKDEDEGKGNGGGKGAEQAGDTRELRERQYVWPGVATLGREVVQHWSEAFQPCGASYKDVYHFIDPQYVDLGEHTCGIGEKSIGENGNTPA